eukprot:scaffold12476_cov126-Isochrysis_galbana.AAC.6
MRARPLDHTLSRTLPLPGDNVGIQGVDQGIPQHAAERWLEPLYERHARLSRSAEVATNARGTRICLSIYGQAPGCRRSLCEQYQSRPEAVARAWNCGMSLNPANRASATSALPLWPIARLPAGLA